MTSWGSRGRLGIRAAAAAATIALVGCSGNAPEWAVVDAPAAEGVQFWTAQTHGDEIWATGGRGDGLEPTLVHYDGATWSRPEAELTTWRLTVAAPDSFWTNRVTDDNQFELVHSTDLVNWTSIDVAAETALPVSQAEVLFAEGDSVWVRAYSASGTFLLYTRGGDWSDVTPPELADMGQVALGGCRRADDDLWLTATSDSFDDEFSYTRSAHWDGATWDEVDFPGNNIMSCRPGELFTASIEPLSLPPGQRIYRQDGAGSSASKCSSRDSMASARSRRSRGPTAARPSPSARTA